MRSSLALILGILPYVACADAFDDAMSALGTGDYAAAVQRLLPLAESGNPNAQYHLAALYDKGQGVTQDPSAALTWFRAAAEQGFAPAQFNLAAMHYEGRGVAQDYVRAAMWNDVAIANATADSVEPYQRFRTALRELMTPEQVADSATLARRCIEASYKGCD